MNAWAVPSFALMAARSVEHIKALRLIAEGKQTRGIHGELSTVRTLKRWGLTENRRVSVGTLETVVTDRGYEFLAWLARGAVDRIIAGDRVSEEHGRAARAWIEQWGRRVADSLVVEVSR